MDVNLTEINVQNYKQVIELCVSPEQERWVGTAAEAIVEVHFHRFFEMRAIALGNDTIVGMIVYETSDTEDGVFVWLHRLLVDCHHQRRGYGRAALKRMLSDVHALPENVYVRTKADNSVALRLYRSLGFKHITLIHE